MEYIIVVVLILFSALFSGLTLGLMGLSAPELKRKMSLGNKDAAKVYEVRKNGNLLLCTLLIGNVAVNTALSIFLGSIASGLTAGLVATALIVVFGEITPQAVFSRFALSIGAKTAWLVKIFIFILYPICWPIARVLDKVLGEELPTIYSKKELMKIVEEHEDTEESGVQADEERIMKGALTFSDKTVEDVMTPRTVVKALECSEKITEDMLSDLREASFSKFPVYKEKEDNIVGTLFISQLVGGGNLSKKVGDIADKEVHTVNEDKNLDFLFRAFLRTHRHLFVVIDEFGGMTGVVTLEDVLEEIIGVEIVDETDKHADLREFAKRRAKKRR